MRIVLCGPEGEELFSGYSVSTLPPPAPPEALPSVVDEAEDEAAGEDPSASGVYLTEFARVAQESR